MPVDMIRMRGRASQNQTYAFRVRSTNSVVVNIFRLWRFTVASMGALEVTKLRDKDASNDPDIRALEVWIVAFRANTDCQII